MLTVLRRLKLKLLNTAESQHVPVRLQITVSVQNNLKEYLASDHKTSQSTTMVMKAVGNCERCKVCV